MFLLILVYADDDHEGWTRRPTFPNWFSFPVPSDVVSRDSSCASLSSQIGGGTGVEGVSKTIFLARQKRLWR